ncbi:MAG: TraB family protein, partial [Treponema sp.]|nr:TraB family protein [Treponema sp.]
LGAWVWWNASLAGIGALIAGGHPLTILVSVIGAPITSLCPFIGIGIVSGIVQAIICKPKVQDMETMQQDALSLKGFYKNRLLRVLLVFVFSSLGSSIGTFLAGANIVKIIASFFDKVVAFVKGLF